MCWYIQYDASADRTRSRHHGFSRISARQTAEAAGVAAVTDDAIAECDFGAWAGRSLTDVNDDDPDAVRGVKVVTQGFHEYGRSQVVQGTDPRGYPYYWFGLGSVPHTPGHDTDLEAIMDGFITVTPLHLDLTHYASMTMLEDAFANAARA